MKLMFTLRTEKNQYILGGIVWSVNKPAIELLGGRKTQLGFYLPGKRNEGMITKFWGIHKLAPVEAERD